MDTSWFEKYHVLHRKKNNRVKTIAISNVSYFSKSIRYKCSVVKSSVQNGLKAIFQAAVIVNVGMFFPWFFIRRASTKSWKWFETTGFKLDRNIRPVLGATRYFSLVTRDHSIGPLTFHASRICIKFRRFLTPGSYTRINGDKYRHVDNHFIGLVIWDLSVYNAVLFYS